MNPQTPLAHLAAACGIEAGYHDIWGNYHELSENSARRLLAGMGFTTDSDAGINGALDFLGKQPRSRLLPRVCVWREGETSSLVLNLDAARLSERLDWQLREEDGALHAASVVPETLERVHEHDGHEQRRWPIPWMPRIGYHELSIVDDGQTTTCALIVSPRRCWPVPSSTGRGRPWGVALQLYGVRSERNWGIGDMGDLSRAVELFGALGADLVGINPLHALYPGAPEKASPYSPSSRRYGNPLYLDIEALEDFGECEAAREQVRGSAFQTEISRLRAAELVDYAGVATLKWPVLEALHGHFRIHHLALSSPRGTAFRQYQSDSGRALRHHATFEVLQSVIDSDPWPAELRDPESSAVAEFAREHAREVEFREYLQWLFVQQLERVRARALASGMRIGIYQDLAVGSDAFGADVWAAPNAYARGVSIGAPPDDFNLKGQIWGLPPWLPRHLEASGYAHFIGVLRANMRSAGALRVDHVVGLMRQFWVGSGDAAADGAFVRYPLHDLLAILALESVRQRCVIVGEDLGTVPDELRAALHDHGVLSYRVLYFSKHWHGDHSFLAPAEFPTQSLVTITTHDLATLAGYWSGYDLDLRERLALFPDDATRDRLRAEREVDRDRLLTALKSQGLCPEATADADSSRPSDALVKAAHRYIARASADLMMVQMEDVLGQIEPINVPGTVHEQPNWRRRLSLVLEDWPEHAPLRELAAALSAERASSTDA